MLSQILICHNLTTDKLVFEIGAVEIIKCQIEGVWEKLNALNDTSSLRCLGALPDRPRTHFNWPAGEIADELP